MDPSHPQCPTCQRPLPVGSPVDLCPYCLLSEPPEVSETSDWAGRGSFIPPKPAELQVHFDRVDLEILGLIGRGGMGAVYRACQPRLDRDVAIKVLPPEVAAEPGFDQRFQREAQVLAKLDHPNIVDVYDFGKVGPYSFLILEFIDGANLRELLAAGHVTPSEALQIVPQLCDALQFAHDHGVVHRDVKPENILIDTAGRVKVMDFGLAKLANETQDRHLTMTRQVMGTLHYMAPEQIERPKEVDHRADIFALGVVFYEMLTGELPLGRFDPPSAKAGTSQSLDRVVMRSLEKEPNRRYTRADEFGSEVDHVRLRQGKPPIREQVTAPVLNKAGELRQWVGSRNLLIILTWLFYVTVIAGVALGLNARRGDEQFGIACFTMLIAGALAWFGAREVERIQFAASDRLAWFSSPLLLLGKPARMLTRLVAGLRWLERQIENVSAGHVLVGWLFMATAVFFLWIFATENDDVFPGVMLFAALAFVAARLSLPTKPNAQLTYGEKWLVYPLILVTLVPFCLAVLFGPGTFSFLLVVESPFRRHLPTPHGSPMRWMSGLYVAAVAQCIWWSIGCYIMGKYPRLVRFVLHPFASDWHFRGIYALGALILIGGVGVASLAWM